MCFSLRQAQEHQKLASESTFLLINLENFINIKDAYDNFSHKNSISCQLSQIFNPKIIRTADMVKIANFMFWHDRTNKISLKMGFNLIFYYKKLLGTLKISHLLYKNKNFISRSTGIQGGQKIRENQFFQCF